MNGRRFQVPTVRFNYDGGKVDRAALKRLSARTQNVVAEVLSKHDRAVSEVGVRLFFIQNGEFDKMPDDILVVVEAGYTPTRFNGKTLIAEEIKSGLLTVVPGLEMEVQFRPIERGRTHK